MHRRSVAVTVADLAAALGAVSVAEAPDNWAMGAYRLAVARSEAATAPSDVEEALALLDKAARILTADRAPVEHGRILTAAANCHRACGRAERALELFVRAAEFLAPRAGLNEHAGALINVGLAHLEAGEPAKAVEALDRAVELILASRTDRDGPGDDETLRLHGAALINRAQARQALGTDRDLHLAVGDYRAAVATLPTSSLQSGMAAHGLGTALLELCRRGSTLYDAQDAVAAFEQSLSVLSHSSFPFHHAVGRHSLALAYEARDEPGDRARALNSAHAAVAVFDPRLHATHWRTAHATLARLEAALDEQDPATSRLDHVTRLLGRAGESERESLLRDRLLRTASLPTTAATADLEALLNSLVRLDLDDYREVLRTTIGVLMELPEQLLEVACGVLTSVHRSHDTAETLDEVLDGVITDRLFGPQRVRVRDLLEAGGWVRP